MLKQPVLYLIIDDMGGAPISFDVLNIVARRSLRLTLSILPYSQHKDAILKECRNLPGVDTMLHAPMQPLNLQISSYNMVLEDDPESTIRAKLSDYLDKVPAQFANNHQGSRVSTNLRTCSDILRFFAERGISFIDSKTTSGTMFAKAAENVGSPILVRDLFLRESWDENLRLLKKAFAKKREVVAIGHPNTILQTLEFIPDGETWVMRQIGSYFHSTHLP